MYRKIMVPVDLTHTDRLDKAIGTAADLAGLYSIPLLFVGVTAETPTALAHTPAEFAQKLEAFGAAQSRQRDLDISTAAYPSHDPAIDLHETLLTAAREHDVDLIVMASHIPGFPDHFFAANAAAVAAHADISVFVIR
jgi:nucleotide-binding universal stress UspA family protein